MTSLDRFQAACEHRTPDRPPVDYLAHPETDRRLRAALGVTTERELLDALGCDFFYVPGRDLSQNEGILPYYKHRNRLAVTATERTCPLGIRWRRGAFASKFAVDEAMAGPLAESATAADILAFPWPQAADFDFTPLQADADANRGRVRIGGLWTGILGDSYRMCGFQNFLCAMATLGRDGGYIFAPSQLLGPDIPVENILEMYGVHHA